MASRETGNFLKGFFGGATETVRARMQAQAEADRQKSANAARWNEMVFSADQENKMLDKKLEVERQIEEVKSKAKMEESQRALEMITGALGGMDNPTPTTTQNTAPGQLKLPQAYVDRMDEASQITSGGFDNIMPHIFKAEGGYSKSDGAGKAPANFGINQRYNPDVNVKNITPEAATQIYKERYWDANKMDEVKPEHQAFIFDAFVNQGTDTGDKLKKASANGASIDDLRAIREGDYANSSFVKGYNKQSGQIISDVKNRVQALRQQQSGLYDKSAKAANVETALKAATGTSFDLQSTYKSQADSIESQIKGIEAGKETDKQTNDIITDFYKGFEKNIPSTTFFDRGTLTEAEKGQYAPGLEDIKNKERIVNTLSGTVRTLVGSSETPLSGTEYNNRLTGLVRDRLTATIKEKSGDAEAAQLASKRYLQSLQDIQQASNIPDEVIDNLNTTIRQIVNTDLLRMKDTVNPETNPNLSTTEPANMDEIILKQYPGARKSANGKWFVPDSRGKFGWGELNP